MYFFFFFGLSSVTVGSAVGSSCLLEVVASSAGEKAVHMDLRTAIKWYLHRGRKKQKTKENNGT